MGRPDLAARPTRQPVDRLAVRALISLDRVALLTQAGQGRARGVRQPAGRLDHGGEARAALALHERDDLGLLGAGARLSSVLILAGSVLLRLAPGLWLRRSLFFAPALVGEPECGGTGLGELEPERLLLLVGAPGRRAALDRHLLHEPEPEELRHRGPGGARLQALGQDREPVLALRGRGQDDQLGVAELGSVRLRHDALRW